jgi:PAS domain S-box-containing protein
MIALVAHAIIRHRLMDIRVVIKQGVVYLVAMVIAGGVLLGLVATTNAVMGDAQPMAYREVVLALLVALGFQPLKSRLQHAFDRYLYREPYDFRTTLRQASRALTGTIEMPALLAQVTDVVERALRPERVAVYLEDEVDGGLRQVSPAAGAASRPGLAMSTPLLRTVLATGRSVFRDELRPGDSDPVAQDLDRLGAEVAVPLLLDGQLVGLLAVGPKRSGDPFYSDDADLLATLANQSAVAVRNAQAHQRVVQINEHLSRILATIESGVIAVSARGRITLFNQAAEPMTGLAAAATRGRPVDCLPPPLARLLQDALADRQSHSQVEIALPDAAGQLLPCMCSTSPLVGVDGGPAGAVAVLSDLSRVKELEHERRRAERLASLEAIASGLVHEVRNPLVSLKAFVDLLPSRHEDPEYRTAFTKVAGRELGRVEDLLARFRTLAAPSRQPMAPQDVRVALDAALELLRPRIEAAGIRLRRVGDGAPRPVLGNASQLEGLFLNLCLNALEAMATGGELTVRVADFGGGGGSTVLVEFSDTGAGIPHDLLDRIFNPFVTTKPGGSGLGLAICRSVADAHHATIRARNNLGRPGATFTVEFPVAGARPVPAGA